MKSRFSFAVAAVLLAVVFSVPGQAASFRTFVAAQPLGNDANVSSSCSLDAPCRTFAVAIGQTTPGGEVIALNTAGYGTATVLTAMTIMALPGVTAFVNVPVGGTGITISAGANDVVILRNLHIGGSNNPNSTGVSLNTGRAVIENSVFSELTTGVLSFRKMDVIDSRFWGNDVAIKADGEGFDPQAVGPATTALIRISGGNINNNGTALFMANPGARPAPATDNKVNITVRRTDLTSSGWDTNLTGNTVRAQGSGTGCTPGTCQNPHSYLGAENPN